MVISQSCFVSILHLMEALSFSRNLPGKKYVDCWDFSRVQICEKYTEEMLSLLIDTVIKRNSFN